MTKTRAARETSAGGIFVHGNIAGVPKMSHVDLMTTASVRLAASLRSELRVFGSRSARCPEHLVLVLP